MAIVDDQAGEIIRKSVIQPTDDNTVYVVRSITQTEPITLIIDEVGNDTYVGKAPIGTATSAALWQLTKLEKSGSVTQLKWADGDANFDNVWDDRLVLSFI